MANLVRAVKAGDASTLEAFELDFQSLCRLCGNMNINLLSVYAEDGAETELLQKISNHLNISVSLEDVLPKRLCIHCSNTLASWHSFYLSCQETNSKFLSMIEVPKEAEETAEEVLEEVEDVELEDQIEFLKEEENFDIVQEGEFEEELEDARRRRLRRKKSKRRLKKSLSKSCSFCPEILKGDTQLKLHIEEKHIERVFHCEQCENYVDRSNLIQHMISHLAENAATEIEPEVAEKGEKEKLEEVKENVCVIKGQKLKCQLCFKEFSKSGFGYHLKQYHEKIKNEKCEICNRVFGCRSTLNNHMKSLHGTERNFSCKECSQAFKTLSSLYIHRKQVHDDKRFSCELCYKKFAFRKQLTEHLLIHSKEQTHFCKICRKGFRVKANLSKHLRVHEDVGQFKCHICYFITSQKRYLAQHMKRKHLISLERK